MHNPLMNSRGAILAELRSLITTNAATPDLSTVLPGVRLASSDTPNPLVTEVSEPVFALVAQGQKRVILGDSVFEYGAGEYLVVPVTVPIGGNVQRASTQAPYLAFIMDLNPAAIAALLLETAGDTQRKAAPLDLAVSWASDELLDAIVRLLRLLDHPSDIAVLRPMVEREILWRLLAEDQGRIVRQIGLADSRLTQISRAIQSIRSNYAASLSIEDLARECGMSTATFYRHFRSVTSMSPLQYQKQIRLQSARAKLIGNAVDIAEVGFAVGYDSPSQFSREYSRLFGTPPSRDAAILRSQRS